MEYQKITKKFVKLENRVPCMIYRPEQKSYKTETGIVLMHSDDDYFEFPPAKALAERGYTVIAAHVTRPSASLDRKLEELASVIEYIRTYPDIEKVLLLGHSGGATLMSAYQKIAENGGDSCRGKEKIIALDPIKELKPADGIMLLDSNFGNGVMTLLSLDPAIIDETNGVHRNKKLDLFERENGYDPEQCHYTQEFMDTYRKAQARRMNQLIHYAKERVKIIEKGEGCFLDDEPMVIPGALQYAPMNKLFPQIPRFFSHTREKWPLIHADGTITVEQIPCLRKMRPGLSTSSYCENGAFLTTVKAFLKSNAVQVDENAFTYDESRLYGIDWKSSYCCTPGNAADIKVPMLLMGMTGSYEYIAAEHIYFQAQKCKDKVLAFVEGASHNFTAERECEAYQGQYGDTVKTCFDYVDKWICERF